MQKSVSAAPKVRHPSEFRQEDWGDKIFDIIVWLLVAVAVVFCVYPFLYVPAQRSTAGTSGCCRSVLT